MTKKPLCSVVMPVYNAEKFIETTLKSVLNQTVKDIEIICVDDCSKDKSVEIIKEYQKHDSRIVLLQNEKNSKVSPYSSCQYLPAFMNPLKDSLS